MKKILIGLAAAISITAAIAETTRTADAGGGGGRAASGGWSHAGGHRAWAGAWRHCGSGGFNCGRRRSVGYDGFVDVPPYSPDVLSSMGYFPPMAYFLAGSPYVLNCRRSQETVTVPSEEGGTRQIVVRRCYP